MRNKKETPSAKVASIDRTERSANIIPFPSRAIYAPLPVYYTDDYKIEVTRNGGEALRDAGIENGDTVVLYNISDWDHLKDGDLILCQKSDGLKLRFFKRERVNDNKVTLIRLMVAHPDFEDSFYAPDEIKLKGVAFAVVRPYERQDGRRKQ